MGPAVALLFLAALAAPPPAAGLVGPPNASFEEGTDSPAGWTLSGGTGGWEIQGATGRRSVGVSGDGSDANEWISDGLRLDPGALYCVAFSLRGEGSGGCAIAGPTSNNRDFLPAREWRRHSFVFRAPDDTSSVRLRFGQWRWNGTVWFDDIEVLPVVPVDSPGDGLVLGSGEHLRGGRYHFESLFDGFGSNHSRPLASCRAGFNTDRLVFSAGGAVTYRFGLPGARFTSGAARVHVGHHVSGSCLVEASLDGAEWTLAGSVAGLGRREFPLPAHLFPAAEVFLRLRAEEGASFQISGLAFTAGVDGPAADQELEGETRYAALPETTPSLAADIVSLGALLPGAGNEVVLDLTATEALPGARVALALLKDGAATAAAHAEVSLSARAVRVRVPYEVRDTGAQVLEIVVARGAAEAAAPLFRARVDFDVPPLYASDYGALLLQDESFDLWWCEGTYKVSRTRALPQRADSVLRLAAARNEYEPVQLVLRPRRPLQGLRVALSPLLGPGGARIEKDDLSVREVRYVRVTRPTDAAGGAGLWPDPLVPHDAPLDLEAGLQQPFWILVRVPPDAPAGDYHGRVSLAAEGSSAEVPLVLHVFDFTLPVETHVKTAFGLSVDLIRRYHRLETDAELRTVLDLYFRDLALHRVSPYDPMALDPMIVDFGEPWEGGALDQENAHAGRRALKVVDESATSNAAATHARLIPIDPQGSYRASWAARAAAPGQQVMLTLTSHDAEGRWIPGGNIDLLRTGSGAWETYEDDLAGRFPRHAAFTRPVLRPARWRDDGATTGTAWFDDIALQEGDSGPNLVEGGDFEPGSGTRGVRIDWRAFDRAGEAYLDGLRFNAFRLPLQGMGGGTFHERENGRIGLHERGTPEYERLFGEYARQVEEHLAAKGWLDEAYLYWFDEPDPKDYDFVRGGMAEVRRFAPGLRRMLTEQPEEALHGAVDIWCPLLSCFDPAACAARQRAGESIWWYVCTAPQGDYCTLFVDHPAIDLRMWLWQTWKFGVEGILVWSANYWTSSCAFPPPALQDPYQDPMAYVEGYGLPAGHVGFWGNGDGRFLYPPEACCAAGSGKVLAGPVDSLRFELLREGIEDYEYFHLLARLVREAEPLLRVPPEICVSLTSFTRDPRPLLEHRRRVAEAIERLSR
ncbi:MAG: DUF4091 domain-containing protein [Planctomycetes bacterium]|nr:DUF4091 domain-containing protein [Planctomycetota bacterium]